MKKTKLRGGRRIMGYALFIKRESGFERVGFLFNNSREASEYQKKHYSHIKVWSINAVRLNVDSIFPERKAT